MKEGPDLVFDVEGNGFLYEGDKLHCIVTYDLTYKETLAFHDDPDLFPCHGTVEEGLQHLLSARSIIGHNIEGYDVPFMKKLRPDLLSMFDKSVRVDTQKLAELLYPEKKKQGIEQWIEDLGLPTKKIQNEDWSVLTQQILNRCIVDTESNAHIFHYLWDRKEKEEREGNSFDTALELEQQVAAIHAEQARHGVYLDYESAVELADKFHARMEELQERVAAEAPPYLSVSGLSQKALTELQEAVKKDPFSETINGQVATFKTPRTKLVDPFTKAGKLKKSVENYLGPGISVAGEFIKYIPGEHPIYTKAAIEYFGLDYLEKVKGPYVKVAFEPLRCSQDAKVKEYLLSLGWVPLEYNTKIDEAGNRYNTSPKLTEESYRTIPVDGLGADIVEYKVLQHRHSLLRNLNDPTKGAIGKMRSDHRVASDAFTCGTPTARYRHVAPICNIPRVSSKYGKEIRGVFGVAPGHLQVGIDLSGIEARMLTHFAYTFHGGPEFAELVNNGDWHQANADLWGCERDDAKSELYALMYGAGHLKLGAILGKGKHVGKKNKDRFMGAYKCYAELVDYLTYVYEENGGYIYGLDGRRFYVRNKKDLLNTCLQGNSAIVFKRWMVALANLRARYEEVYGVPIAQIIAYHDETQNEVYSLNETLAHSFGKDACRLAEQVGRDFNLNVPLAAEYKVGFNWKDCH